MNTTTTREPETLSPAHARAVSDAVTTTRSTMPPKPPAPAKKIDTFLDRMAPYLIGGPATLSMVMQKLYANPEPRPDTVLKFSMMIANDPRFVVCSIDNAPAVRLADEAPAAAPAPVAPLKTVGEMLAQPAANLFASTEGKAMPAPPAVDRIAIPPAVTETITAAADAVAVEMGKVLAGEPAPVNAPADPVNATPESVNATTPAPLPAAAAVNVDAGHAALLAEIASLKRYVTQLNDDNRAMRAKQKMERDAAETVRHHEVLVEAAKNEVSARKADLAEAQKMLAALVYGDAQTEHPDLKPKREREDDDEDQDGDAPAAKPAKASKPKAEKKPKPEKPAKAPPAATTSNDPPLKWDYGVKPDQVISDHQIGRDRLAAVLVEHLPGGDKPPQLGRTAIVEVRGIPTLIRQRDDQGRRWFAQTCLTDDEYRTTYGERFGRAIDGIDENSETRATRLLGGEDCGRRIKAGKKSFVLAPQELGMVLTYPDAEPGQEPVGKLEQMAAALSDPATAPAAAAELASVDHTGQAPTAEEQPESKVIAAGAAPFVPVTPATAQQGVPIETGDPGDELPPVFE